MTSRSEDVKGPLARLNWTNDLFVARSSEEGKPKKFGCELLYPKDTDLSALYAAVLTAAKLEWEDKAEQWIRDGLIKKPFLDGDGPSGIDKKTGERKKGYAGHWFIRATAQEDHKPIVVDRDRNLVVTTAGVRSGWYGYPVVHGFTWTNDKGGKGVSIGISLLQVVKEGDPLGNGASASTSAPNPEKYFEKIADTGAAPEETKTGKGAGGLFG